MAFSRTLQARKGELIFKGQHIIFFPPMKGNSCQELKPVSRRGLGTPWLLLAGAVTQDKLQELV